MERKKKGIQEMTTKVDWLCAEIKMEAENQVQIEVGVFVRKAEADIPGSKVLLGSVC